MQEDQASQQSGPAGPGTTAGAASAGGPGTAGSGTGETPYSTSTTSYEKGSQQPADYERSSAEADGYTTHGGLFLVLAGLLTFLVGLAFVVRHSYYHSHGLYAYNWGIVSWGWVLFGLGIATFAVGTSHLLGVPMSRPLGITLAVLTVVAGFMIIPFYPLWAIIIVALGIAAVWGLAHGAERSEQEQRQYERERQMSSRY
jgi:hypothetical protein